MTILYTRNTLIKNKNNLVREKKNPYDFNVISVKHKKKTAIAVLYIRARSQALPLPVVKSSIHMHSILYIALTQVQ